MSQRHVLLDAAVRAGTRRYLPCGNLLTAAGEEASYQADLLSVTNEPSSPI